MGYCLAVDLGTTYTAAATDDGAGPLMAALGNRALQIPSVVYVGEDGSFLCGEAAERRASSHPDRISREFKRRLGDTVPILVAGQPFSPQALTARLLESVVSTVSERLGAPPDRVVLTYPANWGRFKQELFSQVADLAGLTRVDTCTEPEAAARQYARRAALAAGERVLVYDLGGGTFDVCVLEKTDAGFTILGAPDGVEHLGGIDFDEAVFRHVLAQLGGSVSGLDPDDADVGAALVQLRRECVEAKEALSADVEAVVPVRLPGAPSSVRLTRAELERLVSPAVGETLAASRRALRSAGVEAADLTAVVLVGGSSRIPLVSEVLQRELGVVTALDTHPKHDIALGAATIGAAPTGPALRTEPALPTGAALPEEATLPAGSAPAPARDREPASWPTRGEDAATAWPTRGGESSGDPGGADGAGPPEEGGPAGDEGRADEVPTRVLPVAAIAEAIATPGRRTPDPPTPGLRTSRPAAVRAGSPGAPRDEGARAPRRRTIAVVAAVLVSVALVASVWRLVSDRNVPPPPGGKESPSASSTDGQGSDPTIPPSSLVVPVESGSESGVDLVVVDAGGAPRQLDLAQPGDQQLPSLSADRRHVYFRTRVGDRVETFVVSAAQKKPRPMYTAELEGRACNGRPSVDPGDDGRVALVCRSADGWQIETVSVARNGQLRAATGTPVPGLAPSALVLANLGFVAEGGLLFNVEEAPLSDLLYLPALDAAEPVRLVVDATDAVAAPAGDLTVFQRDGDLYLVRADLADTTVDCPGAAEPERDEATGFEICRLTGQDVGDGADGEFDRDPAWSPNGKQIAFRRGPTELQSTELMVLDLSDPQRVREFAPGLGPVVGAPAWSAR